MINNILKDKLPSDFWDLLYDVSSLSKFNSWMSLKELGKSLIMSCHGIQLKGPVKFKFEKDGRFIVSSFFDD